MPKTGTRMALRHAAKPGSETRLWLRRRRLMAPSLSMWALSHCGLESKNCSRERRLWHWSLAMLACVPFGERITLGGVQRPRDFAHLLVDVVVPRARSEGVELRLEVGALLSFQRRRPLLEAERTVAGGARRDGPGRITERDQRARGNGRALHIRRPRSLDERRRRTGRGRCARRKRDEIGGHIGDFLIVEGRGHALHDRVLPLAGAVVVELLVQHRRWQSGEVWKGVAWTDAFRAVTASAGSSDRFPALRIAGCGGMQRLFVPYDCR